MLSVKIPPISSEKYSQSVITQALKFFIDNLATLHLSNDIYPITSCEDINTKYNIPTTTYKFILTPYGVSYGLTYGKRGTEIYTGYECSIDPRFINSGFKLITCEYTYSANYPMMTLMSMDFENNKCAGFLAYDTAFPAYFYHNAITPTAKCVYVNSDDTVYGSYASHESFILFTRLKPLSLGDGDKYVIMFRDIQNLHVYDNPNKDIYIIDNSCAASTLVNAPPIEFIDKKQTNSHACGNSVAVDNFLYQNKWYSEDIFYIENVDHDQPITANGKYYIPLGLGLFLLARR
jgi:hypothetical protein